MCERTHGRLYRWDSAKKAWIEDKTLTSLQNIRCMEVVDDRLVASIIKDKPTKVLHSDVRASQFENRDGGN